MPADDRSISEFPIAQQLLNTALVLVSNEDGQGGYDSYKATLTELGRVVLETQYTQDLGNMDVFTAIKNCRTLSGTSDPTSQQGADGQLYVKYQTVNNVTSVTGLFVKLSGEWVEISTGGGGDVGIECTQAQYDAWEQAGTLLQDTNYYITDGQSGGGVVIDDTTPSDDTVYSSNKVNNLLSGKVNNAISSLTIESNTKISQAGIHFLLFGKIITLSGVFRAQNSQIMAQETIWTIKNHNLVGQSTEQYYIPVIVDNESGYLYLVAQNDGNDIKIFCNSNLQMPRLMFFNGVLPIV